MVYFLLIILLYIVSVLDCTNTEVAGQVWIWFCLGLFVLVAYSGFVVSFFKLSSIYTNPFIRLCEFMIGITIGCIRADYKINLKAGFSGLVFLMSFVILLFGVSIIYNVFSYDDYMQYNWFLIPSSGIMIYYSTFMMDDRYSKVLRYLSNLSYCYFLAQLFSNFIAQLVISRFGVSSNTI